MGDLTTAAGATQNDNDNSGIFTQVRNRCKKSKKNDMIDNVLDSVASQCSAPITSQAAATPNRDEQTTSLVELRKTVDELTSTVLSQKLTIEKLSCQLNFVLSYLDISDTADGITSISGGVGAPMVEVATTSSVLSLSQQTMPTHSGGSATTATTITSYANNTSFQKFVSW